VSGSGTEVEKELMKTWNIAITLSALLLIACNGAWAQLVATNASASAVVVTNKPPVWHGDVAAGLSLARGNANTFVMTASASAENVWDKNDLKLGADGEYGLNNWGQKASTNGTRQGQSIATEEVHGFTDYKRLITERFYGDLRLDLFHDDVADVRYRAILGPALGYYFIKTDATKLNADIGASYVRQRLDAEANVGYATLHAGEHGEHAFSKTAKIWEDVQYFPQLTYWANYLVNAEAGVEAAINAHFSLRAVADDHYNNRPAPGRLTNDILMAAQLDYKY
jgi:putative salt-induced outer membrane protein YdiY